MGECGVSCAKYSVFIFNLIFALSGIAVLTVGAIIFTAYHHYQNFVGEIWSAPVILMVVGGIVFFIAFLGCCGAIKESPCMILTFSILLAIIFMFEIGIGISAYTYHPELKKCLERGFNNTLNHYEANEKAWSLIQRELDCCGVNGPEDWKNVFHNDTLPPTCCPQIPANDNFKNCTKEYASKDGCEPKLLDYFDSKSALLGGVGLAVCLVQLIGVGYACCLHRAFRRNYEAV